MITITQAAADKIKEIATNEDIGHQTVRIKLMGGGCSGYKHDIDFDNKIRDTDEVINIGDIKVIVDPVSFQYMENTTVDYVKKAFEEGFKFTSPDITSSCGCGNSVSYS